MNTNSTIDNQIKIMPVNFNDNNLYTSYHPYTKSKKFNVPESNYPVNIQSNVDPIKQWTNAHEEAPKLKINGGLYSGPQSNNIGVPKPVIPTATYFMQELLSKVSPPPPPGATEQYPSNNRPGNNYISMPGVEWYNPQNKGPYHIKVIKKSN